MFENQALADQSATNLHIALLKLLAIDTKMGLIFARNARAN